MLVNNRFTFVLFMILVSANTLAVGQAQTIGRSEGKSHRTLREAASQSKYTFLLFYKSGDSATQKMAAILKKGLAGNSGRATIAYVKANDPAERGVIAKYGLSRAPVPLTVVVAPNGALTAVFAKSLTVEQIDDAFVTPTMMVTMKSLQAGKIVLVNAQGSRKSAEPRVLKSFQSDPHFKNRLVSISMKVADPREGKFVKQMQLDPAAKSGRLVIIAPPGVLIGKFDVNATKNQIAAALAKAGKCCNDPKCKHNR